MFDTKPNPTNDIIVVSNPTNRNGTATPTPASHFPIRPRILRTDTLLSRSIY
ncbi:hypothetical protein ASPWEDRAFT_35935 [Aspergillus wentii DTO 134E9]|uniref:Uncharacterized protein n=1 Tax=Aspergillus wentii DTO 134E9 TaxID=1073089 RepID=A0A1L9RTY7_ASPWE|nr:uncharacterized protein ASPWEDRAFT_35935 [Aspergillus wentii DTO 134E9]OJJ38328.1 hypothetical protein ASPWEDRAFT_35935 [Aspergillus wentii DTO 134E9]